MKTKNLVQKTTLALTMLLVSLFSSLTTFAQDATGKLDVNINTDGGAAWYGQPWVWIVGVALFILILVIVTRSNKGADA